MVEEGSHSQAGLRPILFVCTMNERRSLTAEHLFARDPRLDVRSRATVQGSARSLRADDVAWAEMILVMEARHLARIEARFPADLAGTPVHVLDIPDRFDYMAPELVALLETRALPLIWP